MKVLVVLCAVVASCLAKPNIGYAYSAISPLTGYSSIAAPYSYAYSAPIISAPYAVPYAAPYAAPVAPVVAAGVKTQYHSQNELGEAKYGHSEPLQAHDAVQDAHGNKIGSYSYVDPHGAVHRTDYVADSLGYRVAANDLPLAPAGPGPVVPAETPEVVAAKAHHYAAHHAAAAGIHLRKRRNAYYGSYYGPQAIPVVTPSGHLADTPEVAAAKAAHFAEHAKASGHVAYAAPYSYHSGAYAAPVVTPSGFLADTPEVAAAKAAHLHEHALRGKRSIFYQTPASTSPLFHAPLVAPVAPVAPVAYAAPIAHAAPVAYAAPHAYAAPALGVPAIKTEITHNPGHAASYRIDSLVPHY